jgi:hypothetical protein
MAGYVFLVGKIGLQKAEGSWISLKGMAMGELIAKSIGVVTQIGTHIQQRFVFHAGAEPMTYIVQDISLKFTKARYP